MIDISDGLLSDIRHICNKSRVGFKLYQERLPLSAALLEFCNKFNKNPYEYALTSGEEFEILFTSNKNILETINVTINNIPITPIGEIIADGNYFIRNDQIEEIAIDGFDHFQY